jgi:hypothetical protein
VLYLGTTVNDGELIVRDASTLEVLQFHSKSATLYIGTSTTGAI